LPVGGTRQRLSGAGGVPVWTAGVPVSPGRCGTAAAVFVVLAAAGVTGSAWLLVLGFTGHGLKDLWQHRNHYVANTRWWPPFCLIVD
jgi:hypothetical protein